MAKKTYNITLTANHQSLTAEYLPLAAESVQYLTAKVVCETEDWTGREIKALFGQGCTVYEIPVTGGEITAKQQLNLTAGDWCVWLVGNSARDVEVIPRITTNVAHISVAPTGGTEGNPFPTMPPTVEEQLRADMGNLADLTTEDKSSLVAAINEAAASGGSKDAVTYTPQTLTEAQQAQARANIGAGQPVFAVNVTLGVGEDGRDNYTADKTAAEIEVAYQAGRTIVCKTQARFVIGYIPVELPLMSRTQERVFSFAGDQLVGSGIFTITVEISDSGVKVSTNAADIYEKPADGIPKSDLASDVQTSLAKADTAISYDSQTLTEAQQAQARANIGAVDENLGCNKYNIHVTTTSGTTKDFTYYTNEGEIRQPTEAVDSSIRTAFLGLTLWPSAKGISENLAKTLSKQYKILYDANYIDSPCCIIKSPLESGDNVLLSYHSSDNTVQVSGNWTDGYYNIIYDVANDALTHFYVSNNISAVNGAVNQLVMSAAPTEDMHIATKQYVDTAKTEAQQLGLTAATPGQIIKVKAVQDGKPTEWEAVNPDYTLTVTVNTQDGVTVTGQTVTVRAGDADGPVYGTAEYNGQPVSFRVADGFAYYAEVTDNLAAHFRPTTVKGVINGANAAVTLLYNDLSTIQTAPDIQAALDADMDLTELVGQQITCQRGNDTLSWDVVDYDSVAKVVTLCTHDVLPDNMQFEPNQALMYCEDGLVAGSYTFKWNNTQCYFTLTQAIPVGGQLMATNSAFQTYESVTATAQIESGTVSTEAIDGATNLGQTGTGNLNHHDRANYGSNNFGESGILQWLNSDSPANTPLPRLTKFSRPYVPTKAGFKAGLDADFLACIQDTVWKCSANNVYECPASLGGIAKKDNPYTVTAKFALASEIEVFGEYRGVQDVGTVWDLYVGAEATDRIKYYNNTARSWWLRSPNGNNTRTVRNVRTPGTGGGIDAISSNGVAVACKIAKPN